MVNSIDITLTDIDTMDRVKVLLFNDATIRNEDGSSPMRIKFQKVGYEESFVMTLDDVDVKLLIGCIAMKMR